MKKQEFITLCLTACLIIAFQSVQAQWGWWGNGTKGNGNVVEQKRELRDFDSVTASSGLDVYITQGNKVSVVVEADENLQNQIETVVEGNNLKLYVKGSIGRAKAMKVHVQMPEIVAIHASSGSDVYGENKWSGDELEIKTSGGSDVKLDLNFEHIDCITSGGSDAELSGKASTVQLVSSGGSDIEADELVVERCAFSSSGGSDVHIYVKEHIEGSASGASDIYLHGNPSSQQINTSGASDLHKKM
ncbi:MAG: head GIN domain-containing protein [Bacteroidota bacterium]